MVADEGQVQGQGSKKRDTAEIAGGAGLGATIGAGAGAAAGTGAVLMQRGKDIRLPRGSELTIQLDRPPTVPVK